MAINGMDLARIRAYHGISVADLSRLLQVNERTIRRWESGEAELPTGILPEIAAIETMRGELYFHLQKELPPQEFDGIDNVPNGLINITIGEVLAEKLAP